VTREIRKSSRRIRIPSCRCVAERGSLRSAPSSAERRREASLRDPVKFRASAGPPPPLPLDVNSGGKNVLIKDRFSFGRFPSRGNGINKSAIKRGRARASPAALSSCTCNSAPLKIGPLTEISIIRARSRSAINSSNRLPTRTALNRGFIAPSPSPFARKEFSRSRGSCEDTHLERSRPSASFLSPVDRDRALQLRKGRRNILSRGSPHCDPVRRKTSHYPGESHPVLPRHVTRPYFPPYVREMTPARVSSISRDRREREKERKGDAAMLAIARRLRSPPRTRDCD